MDQSEKIVELLQRLLDSSSIEASPDKIDVHAFNNGANPYTVRSYFNRSHMLIIAPSATLLSASIPGLPLNTSFNIPRGWSVLDFPIATTFVITNNTSYNIIYSNTVRGPWVN